MADLPTLAELCGDLDELVATGAIDDYDETVVAATLDEQRPRAAFDDESHRARAVFDYLDRRGVVVEYPPDVIHDGTDYEGLVESYATVADGWLDGVVVGVENADNWVNEVGEPGVDVALTVEETTVEATMTAPATHADTATLTGLVNDALDAVGAPRRFYTGQYPTEFGALFLEPDKFRPLAEYFDARLLDRADGVGLDAWASGNTACAVCDRRVDPADWWPSTRFSEWGRPVHPRCRDDL